MSSFIISWIISGTLIGLLAARKNRSGLLWGLVGGFFLVPGLIVLAFKPYLCPMCRNPLAPEDVKSKKCPYCSGRAGVVHNDEERQHHFEEEELARKRKIKAGLLPSERMCENCGTTYDPTDYDQKNLVWLCSTCKRSVPRE